MGNQPLFVGRINRSIGFVILALLFLSSEGFALNPPPDVHDAYCWGKWATGRLSQKIINKDEVVTLKVDIVGGPPAGSYCGWAQWRKQGVDSVALRNPNSSCFQIVDYSPKGDLLHKVTSTAGGVTWTAQYHSTAPPPTVNANCYCRSCGGGQCSDTSGCPSDFWPSGHYGPGDSFTLTLKATCADTYPEFVKVDVAQLSGNWGVSCSGDPNIAQDYYKLGGQAEVYLEASPQTLPADGSQSALTARVIESTSGVALPRQRINFSGNFGIFNPVSAETDSNGAAVATVASTTRWGEDLVQAFIPGSQASTWVTFTQVNTPPVNPRSKLGEANTAAPVVDPVHAGLGNYIYSKYLFSFPGKGLPFNLKVNYNSFDNAYNGPLGFGWTHTFNVVLTPPAPPSTDLTIKWGDGHEDTFRDDGSGQFIPFNCNTTVTVTKPDAGHYLATLYNKSTYLFDSSGRLLAISDLNGNQISLTHSAHLDRITDTAGRQIDFIYSGGRLSAITSPLKSGNTVSFQYDGAGNLTGLIDPRGKTWGFTYDGSHRILTQVDAKGVTVVTNTYDGSGRVAQQQDGGGNLTSFEYTVDSSGTRTKITPPSGNFVWHYYDLAYNLTQVIDGEGHQAQFISDSQGRLVGAVDKSSSARQIVYDAGGNLTMAVDGAGAMAQFVFDAKNRPTSVTDPLNHTTSFEYDANGNLTDARNPNGNRMTVTVGPNGLPGAISDFLGRKWSTSYDGNGLPQTITDPAGAKTVFTFDAAGRVTNLQLPVAGTSLQTTYDEGGNVLTRTDPLGRVTALTYDNNGLLNTSTFVPTGAVTTYAYDWAGRPKSVTNPLGVVTTYTYDADGHLLNVTDPDGVTMTRQYDKSNRLTALMDPLGHRVLYGYDAAGNPTSITNELGDTWTTIFDAEGRPTQTSDPLGNTYRSVYDGAGRLERVTDPLNYSQTYEYDAAGRVVSTTQPDGGVVGYVNDANGRPKVVTDPLGHSWLFAYDNAGRLASETDPNGKTAGYAYDGLGRVISKTLRDGKVITYTYDAGSRLTRVTLPGPVTINYAYDAAGNLTGITDPSGTTTMTYDLLGRRLTRTDPNGKAMAFSYTPAGKLKTLTYPGGLVATYSYDTAGRLADIMDWKGNQTTFQYDTVNRVTQVNLPNGTRTVYIYDGAGRVAIRENRKSDDTVLAGYVYNHTSTGQIASVLKTEPVAGASSSSRSSYSFDSVNRLLKAQVNDTAATYAFDDRGNLISKTSGGATTTYAYDALNRLVSVADGTNTTTYTYDGSGNRLSKTYNGTTTRYVREGGTIYCTLDGSGNVQSYNLYAGSLLYSLDAAGTGKVYHSDERGSIVAITDASQNLLQSYAYDPYGKVIGGSGSLPNAFRYVGAYGVQADDNGLYHMQARYYDPEVRRFITEDPLGLSKGLNLFEYTGGDPINYMDPSGTDFEITREGVYSASNVPIDVVWTEPVPSGGYFPKWRNDYLGTPSRTPGTYWGGVSPGKEIMPFELQPKAIMPKNVQPQNLWGLAPVEKTSVKGLSWWKLPPETPVGLPEGLATSPETDKMVTDWWYKKGQFSGKGVAPLQKSITVRGGGGASVKGAVMEGGMAFYLGYVVFDTYMNQGKVWDSFDNSWKPWGQYKEEHIFNNLPPWMKNAWAQGSKWMGENEFGADVLAYGPVQGPTIYVGDWLKRKAYSFLDGLTKKW